MRVTGGTVRISATDLTAFIACKHLTLLELARSHGLDLPERELPHAALADLARRGEEHEAVILERYRVLADGDVVSIPKEGDDEDRCRQTRAALAARRKVIYQGVLLGDGQFGAPDFLVRGDVFDSEGDPETYAVVDAKLARSAKANAVLQTAFYSRLLKEDLGSVSEWMYLELGDGVREPLRVADFAAYEAEVHRRLREYLGVAPAYPIADPYPEKVEHCGICSWRRVCGARRRADDDLSLVAGAGRRQRDELKLAEVKTRVALAEIDLSDPPEVDMSSDTLRRLHLQALAQVKTEDPAAPFYELADDLDSLTEQLTNAHLHHDPAATRRAPLRGLFALPEPHPADLFFDLEAARFYGGGTEGFGLEYLFGVVEGASSGPRYSADWAFDRDGERDAFERFITRVHNLWLANPGMHVYHYNHYEPTALDRLADRHSTMTEIVGALMGRHSTKVVETDDLIRNRVFVDLYPIFRQSIRAGIESYSLKQTERVAGYERVQALEEADGHMIAFQRVLEEGAQAAREAVKTQTIIAAYNEDDCVATLALRDWLEERRSELAAQLGGIPRPPARFLEAPDDLTGAAEFRVALHAFRGDGLDQERRLLGDLLEYQKREAKPAWWDYFYVRQASEEELLASRSAIVRLAYIGPAETEDGEPMVVGVRSVRRVYDLSFPPQDQGLKEGKEVFDPSLYLPRPSEEAKGEGPERSKDGPSWKIVGIDEGLGVLRLAAPEGVSLERDAPPQTLVVGGPPNLDSVIDPLLAYARQVLETDGQLDSHTLMYALLSRAAPQVEGGIPFPLTDQAADPVAHAVEKAVRLKNSVLPIQGPPGSGKTFTAGEIVVRLLEEDPTRKIGVLGPSHAVVRNLLKEISARRAAHDREFLIGQYAREKADRWEGADRLPANARAAMSQLVAGEISVLGGTAWLWAIAEAQADGGILDTLLIDEAGQVPLAHAVAAAGATANRVVLLGDPQQLPQVTTGAHPEGVGISVLAHLLGSEVVIPPDRGIFLARTRRMHDDITSFVSDAFYLGALEGTPGLGLDLQAVQGAAPVSGSGIRLADVEHEGNDSSSNEEADVVADAVVDLLGRTWVDRHGDEQAIEPSDILVVTPYNAQIAAIARELRERGDGASHVRVGTVDKFQGQEAAVVIYSMATSSADEAPRGMEFLYQLNRLNVATSRAKAMAIVVMSPELVRVDCKTPRQMVLASAHCLLRSRATAI